jgi:hypothetical protein
MHGVIKSHFHLHRLLPIGTQFDYYHLHCLSIDTDKPRILSHISLLESSSDIPNSTTEQLLKIYDMIYHFPLCYTVSITS